MEVESHNVSKIKIPFFNPESPTGGVQARAWIAFVKMARKSAGIKDGNSNWSDEVTCTNAIMTLQGSASKWIENIVEANTSELTVWADFEKSFRTRFIQPLSLIDKINLLDLKMTATESVATFYDRCVHNINLFYDEEWEVISLNDIGAAAKNWSNLGEAVTAANVKSSKEFHKQCKEIQLKIAFASGLKDSIKRLTLVQPTETRAALLAVAQRVESSQREIKRELQLNILDLDDMSVHDDTADVDAVNFRSKKQGGPSRSQGQGRPQQKREGPPNSCFYCLKQGHYKPACLTRKNDRAKGVFKSNVNSTPAAAPKRQNANVDLDDDGLLNVSNAQADITDFFQLHGAN